MVGQNTVVLYLIYYVENDMFRPLRAIFRPQKYMQRKTIQNIIVVQVHILNLKRDLVVSLEYAPILTNIHCIDLPSPPPPLYFLWPEDSPQWPKPVVVSIIKQDTRQLCFDVPHSLHNHYMFRLYICEHYQAEYRNLKKKTLKGCTIILLYSV